MATERTSDEIERDLASTRARLDERLDAIQDRLSPGQMVDEAMGYLRRTGATDQAGEFGRNMARTARDNPIPLALVGIGLSWLMVSGPSREPRHAERRDDDFGPRTPGYVGAPSRSTMSTSTPSSAGWEAERQTRGGGTVYANYEGGPLGGYEEGYRPPSPPDEDEERVARAYAAEAAIIREESEEDSAFERRRLRAKADIMGVEHDDDEQSESLRDKVDNVIAAAKERYEAAKRRVADWRDQGSSAWERSSAQGRQNMDDLRRRADETSQSYAARMRVMRDDYERRAHYYRTQAGDRFTRGRAAAGHYAEDLSERASELFERQPLVVGAIGLAAGAALAAVLPMTRREQSVMGPYRDQLYDDASNLADDYWHRAQRAGEAALDAARSTAEEEGLTPEAAREGARGAAQDLGSKVRHVADEARSAAESEFAGASSTTGTGSTTSATTGAGGTSTSR